MVTGIALILIILTGIILMVVACSLFRWHPLLVLLIITLLVGLAVRMPVDMLLDSISSGAGSVFASIGLIIALGTILGEILEQTGATHTLARKILSLAGRKNLSKGMSSLGAIVGIPVFCDSGFIIISNLAKSLARLSSSPYGAISIALATGLYTTHVLVPPTPGPLAAAGNLGVAGDLGHVMLLGLLVSVPAVIVGNLMANTFSKKEVEKIPDPEPGSAAAPIPENTPRFSRAIIPLLLPVVLIGAGSFIALIPFPVLVAEILYFITKPFTALLIGVLIAIFLLPVRGKTESLISSALSQSGSIILITTAGGAFGAVLKATPLSAMFSTWMNGQQFSTLAIFPIAFLLAAALKTAQGSSTASMVITSSILAPLLPALGLDQSFEKALLVLTIGGGAMTVSHANDSYFWVIQQYSGISVRSMYRYFTLTTLFMGLTVLITCMLLSLIF